MFFINGGEGDDHVKFDVRMKWWIFNNTGGSVLLVAVLHASEIWLAYLMIRLGTDPLNLNNYFGYGMLMILTSVIIIWVTGPENLSRTKKRIII